MNQPKKSALGVKVYPARFNYGKFSTYLLTIVKAALFVTAATEAVILTTVFLLTAVVVTLKLTDELPAGTFTVAGTIALLGLLLNKLTTKPPVGAGAVSVTVPLDATPPRTVVGLSANAESAADVGGFTVSVADLVTPL
jgi:hypothetical protein